MLTVPASDASRIHDEAELLTESQRAEINLLIEEAVSETNVDFAIVTTNDMDMIDVLDYADLFYEVYGLGVGAETGGVILIVDMGTREVTVLGHGSVEYYFKGDTTDKVLDAVQPRLTRRQYERAMQEFVKTAEWEILKIEQPWRARLDGMYILKCIAVGAVISLIVIMIIFQFHKKGVHRKSKETEFYIDTNQIRKTREADVITGSHTRETFRPRDSGSSGGGGFGGSSGGGGGGGGGTTRISGTSSSGRSYSGGSHKF